MKLSSLLLFVTLLFIPVPVKAEIYEISNPSCQEVPGTKNPNASEQFSDPVYIDVNGLVRNGEIITFEMVDPHVNYVQI